MKINIKLITIIAAGIMASGCTQQVASPNPNGGTEVASDTVSLGSDSSGSYSSNRRRGGKAANSVYFDYDSNKLKSRQKNKIAKDINKLKRKKRIKVEGNSDEFGTDEYNYALGLKRAKAVKDSMVAKGVSADKIDVVSYGEANPLCKDGTKKCYKKNRRADYDSKE